MYVRKYRDNSTGQTYVGKLQGNGGTAVPITAIMNEIKRVHGGRSGRPRFFESSPGKVRIYLSSEAHRAHNDPAGWVEIALENLEVVE